MIKGLVINAKSSFFYCLVDNNDVIECRASKKLKLNKQKIITGDYVKIDRDNNYIIDVYPRHNELKRPVVANIDESILVFSAVEPSLSWMLLDKMLLLMEYNQIPTNIIVTKMDLLSKQEQEKLMYELEYYEKIGYGVFYKNQGLDDIVALLQNKKFLFVGQSGVGKSTLINDLCPELNLKTQAISKALNRGKHTTRELTFYQYQNGFIVDTPGFSSLDLNMSDIQIRDCMKEYRYLADQCKFAGCFHYHEPGCEVKINLGKDQRFDRRYNNYINLLEYAKEHHDSY